MKDILIENFKLNFPLIAEQACKYHDTVYNELVIELISGDTVLYDDIERSIRRIPSSTDELTEDMCRREFGFRLTKIMRHKNISQLELSELTGINNVMLSRYINGVNIPSLYKVVKIARTLGCPIDDLIWQVSLKKHCMLWPKGYYYYFKEVDYYENQQN